MRPPSNLFRKKIYQKFPCYWHGAKPWVWHFDTTFLKRCGATEIRTRVAAPPALSDRPDYTMAPVDINTGKGK